jgi:hypothetical protein
LFQRQIRFFILTNAGNVNALVDDRQFLIDAVGLHPFRRRFPFAEQQAAFLVITAKRVPIIETGNPNAIEALVV